jgi:hypothetical protein
LIEDKDIKTPKSPFAMRQNEVKVFDGKEGYASINQVVFKVDMGYINEIHFTILEIISEFEFITSRQLYQILTMRGIEVKSQDKVNDKLEDLIKSKVITRYYFSSDEGKGIFRVYCLEKIGKHLLNSRNIKCDWVPTDNTKPVYMLKRKLAANQILLAYMRKVKSFKGYKIEPVLMSKKQNSRFKPALTVSLVKDGKVSDFLYEVIRRNASWPDKFLEKLTLYKEFYEYFQSKDGGFEHPPQLVIIGEDDAHLIEAFKIITKNKIALKGVEIYYTTDLRQLDDTLEKSLISFRYDEAKAKFIMDILEVELLAGEVLPSM